MEKDEVTANKATKKKKNTGTVKQQSVTLKATGNSLTGKPLDNIEINPQLDSTRQVTEQSRGGVVLTFGRMNPPTVGHEKLVDKVKDVASSKRATPMVFLSHSQDKKKNPLDYEDKVRFARAAFGKIVQHAPQKTLIDILKNLQSKFTEVTLVVGSDRVNEFETLLNKYNGKDYTFDKIDVVSAGERDPDAEGVSGMSASKMRAAVQAGDEKKFIQGLPRKLHAAGKQVYDLVRSGMQLQEELEQGDLLSEVLNVQQRRQRALIMKRYAPRIKRARELAQRRLAADAKLKKRAMIQARDIVRKRVAGRRGAEYASLSPSEKIQVDIAVEKRKKVIGKIAKRILPKVKQAEFQRLKSYMQGHQMEPKHTGMVSVQKESMDELNTMFVQYAEAIDTTSVEAILEEMTNLVLDKIITEKQVAALEKRSNRTGIDYDLLEQVYVRGLIESMGDHQAAFNRVNAFCCGGRTAMNEDYDLYQLVEKPDINDVFESKNKPYVKPHYGSPNPQKQTGWKASNKHGKVKYFGLDFKKSASKHAGIDENFLDGKGPGKPGDSARHGLKGKSAAELRKIRSSDKASPRKKQLAHWMLNMHHNESADVNEDLRKWFDQKWVRMDTKGEIKGDCAREEGEGKPKCLPLAKARAMDKEDRAKAARRKRREDPVADREGKGGKPVNVRTEAYLEEKSSPTNPALWSRAKALARQKFDVYPSAYANGWAAKWYKSKGGGWKSVSEEVSIPDDLNRKLEKVAKQLHKSVAAHAKQRDVIKKLTSKDKKDVNESLNTDHYKALTDIELNTKNRDMTTKNDGYGPLNPSDEKGSKKFWEEKAKMWNTTVEAAKTSLCGNCAAFNQSKEVMDKIAEGLGPEGDKINKLADLGFCEIWEFKCAAARTCNVWIHGGPIKEDLDMAFENAMMPRRLPMKKHKDETPSDERRELEYMRRGPDSPDEKEEPNLLRRAHAQVKKKVIDEEGNSQPNPRKRLMGTDDLVKAYKKDTPGQSLDESFVMAQTAGVGITLTAADLGIKAQGGFAFHPSVIEDEDETDEDV